MNERVGQLHVESRTFPRRSELVVVLQGVFVESPHTGLIAAARAGDGGFEAAVVRDGVVRQDCTVTPTSYAQARRVGDPHSYGVIVSQEQILNLFVPPVGFDTAREFS